MTALREAITTSSGDFKVVVEDFNFVEGFLLGSSDVMTAPRADGAFLRFVLRITNASSSADRISPGSITLRDAKGRTFEPDIEAMAFIAVANAESRQLVSGSAPELIEFQPGVVTEAQVVFDVPRPQQSSKKAAAAAGYELVLDLGFRDGIVSTTRVCEASDELDRAYNRRFDRLMAAYDEASAPDAPVKTFKVKYGRPRTITDVDVRSAVPPSAEEIMAGGPLGWFTGAHSSVGYVDAEVAVCGNGIRIDPGWHEAHTRKPPSGTTLNDDGTIPLPVEVSTGVEQNDPRSRLERLRLIRERLPAATRQAQEALGLSEGPAEHLAVSAYETAEEGGAHASTRQLLDRAARLRADRGRGWASDAPKSEALRLLLTHKNEGWLLEKVPGGPQVLLDVEEFRVEDVDSDWRHIASIVTTLASEPVRSSYAPPPDPVRQAREALWAVDILSGVAKVMLELEAAIDTAILEEDARAVQLEKELRSEMAFLPFIQGWFGSLDGGMLFKQVCKGGSPSAPLIGIGALGEADLAWLKEASIDGAPTSELPADLGAENSCVVIDPSGCPIVLAFSSAADRTEFLAQVKDAAAAWANRWRSVAAEYDTLEIGESMSAGLRAMQLEREGRKINLMARSTWHLP